jgi:hypothetical protein
LTIPVFIVEFSVWLKESRFKKELRESDLNAILFTALARSQPTKEILTAQLRLSRLKQQLLPYSNSHIANMSEQLVLRGTLEGHSGWVTSLATSLEKYVYHHERSFKSLHMAIWSTVVLLY